MQYCRLKIEIMSECNVDLIEQIRKCIILVLMYYISSND